MSFILGIVDRWLDRWANQLGDMYSALAEWHMEIPWELPPRDPELRWYYEEEVRKFRKLERKFNRQELLFRFLNDLVIKLC